MLFLALSIIFLIFALLPLYNNGHWAVRALDFPRLHLFLISTVILIILLFNFDSSLIHYLSAALFLTAISLDIYRIHYYIPGLKKETMRVSFNQSDRDHKVSILTSNVRAKNKDYQELLELVNEKDPDCVLLIEANQKWQDATTELKDKYPHHLLIPKDNTYGFLFYSKHEMTSSEIMYLVDKKVPSLHINLKLPSEETVNLFCLHPRPPRPKEGPSHERDAELMETVKKVRRVNDSTIVFGDLNDVAWSHTTRLFLRLTGLLDPRRGRGIFNTFPAKMPFIGFPLDHIFHSKDLCINEFCPQNDIGSDHLPFFASFILKKSEAKEQSPLDKKKDKDEEEMNELLNRKKLWNGPNEQVDDEA